MALMPAALSDAFTHVESKYPEEGCGMIFRTATGALRVHPMRNVYDLYHSKRPETFPRNNRTAYLFDPKEHLAAVESALAAGETLVCVFHSHADVGAYFSGEDKAMAAPDGLELQPGVLWLVVAVDQAKTTAAKLFRFENGDFLEIRIETLWNPTS